MNRRELIKKLGFGAASIIPVAAYAKVEKVEKQAIGPVLLEMVCDGGKSTAEPDEWERLEREYPNRFRGCGTRFRWYLGVNSVCPECGTTYQYTSDMLHSKKFFVNI